MAREQMPARKSTDAMAGPPTDPVVYPDLDKLKKQTANFQKNVRRSIVLGAFEDESQDEESTPAAPTANTDDPEQATQLGQFRYLIKHQGNDLVEYILTLRQHNNDALDLNDELTGLVTSHEALQTSHEALQEELETVKADLAGSRNRAKKLREELAAAKRELAASKEQPQTAQGDDDDGSITRSRSSDQRKKVKWPDAPILTDGVNPTFEAWAQKVVQKTDRNYPDPQDQIDYACSRVGGQAEAYLAPRVRVGTTMPFNNRDEVLEFLYDIMADPNPRQTSRHKLEALTQGKMEFAEFYGHFITQVVNLDYSEQAQIDILLDKIDRRLRRAWDNNVNPPTTLIGVRRQLLTLDQNIRQTDKRFPQQQPSSSRFSTAKASTGPTPKPAAATVPAVGATVTIRPKRTLNPARISDADRDRERYIKEGRCFKCGRQGHMKPECPENNLQIKNVEEGSADEEVPRTENAKNA